MVRLILYLAVTIIWMLFWIRMIINAAKTDRFIWLTLIIFVPLTAILYRLLTYTQPYYGPSRRLNN